MYGDPALNFLWQVLMILECQMPAQRSSAYTHALSLLTVCVAGLFAGTCHNTLYVMGSVSQQSLTSMSDNLITGHGHVNGNGNGTTTTTNGNGNINHTNTNTLSSTREEESPVKKAVSSGHR
jgi:hypothetical protein